MKYVIAAILVLLVLVLLGWLTLGNTKDSTIIRIEKQEIKDDSREAAEKGKELIHDLSD